MAKKNPEHFQAAFEFHKHVTFVSCSCGDFTNKPTLNDAIAWLERHHDSVPTNTIYKED